MSLKYRLLMQSILVFLITGIVTGCIGFAYIYFFNLLNNTSVTNGVADTAVIVVKNDNIIYKNRDLSNVQVKDIMLNISINKNEFVYNDLRYSIKEENFTTQDNNRYKIIKLTPEIDFNQLYLSFIVFIIFVFIVVFIIVNSVVQRSNLQNIINPIINLKRETENLKNGDLETAISDDGYGEVRELGRAVEQLRIKLKDSLFYQKKFDENRKFLISSISHDLKTPVTAVRGYIDGVLEGVADTEEKKKEYLQKAVERTKVINTIINDLLLYSKLDMNQISFQTEKVDIVKYIEYCVEDNLMQFERENKQICIENERTEKRYVNIDSERFMRVVQNVVDNARKNIEEGEGRLTIKLRETNSAIILEFKDNGTGIKQEDLPHIFDRFYRADTARKVEGSSGLGLAIAKQIVEGLGGRIWAISKEGEGASIIISLKKYLQSEVVK